MKSSRCVSLYKTTINGEVFVFMKKTYIFLVAYVFLTEEGILAHFMYVVEMFNKEKIYDCLQKQV